MLFKDLVEINPKVELTEGESYPFVEMKEVDPSRGYIEPSYKKTFKNGGVKFEDEDTLFARITPCLENGKIARFKSNGVKQGFGSTEFFVFRAKPGISDPNYIYYLVNTSFFKESAERSMAGASGRQRADLNAIKELEIHPPDLQTQQKIGSTLSAFDDLIENNNRRIEILEEMAQLIYREWFVHLRYPGHEQDEFVDSELGQIPSNWEISFLDDFGPVKTGKTPSKKDSSNFGCYMPFIRIPDMHDKFFINQTGLQLSKKGAASQNSLTLPPDTVITSCIGTTGLVAITKSWAQTNQQINAIIPSNPDSREYLFHTIKGLKPKMEQIGEVGATMGNVSKGKFKSLKVFMPKNDILRIFHKEVGPLFNLIAILEQKNEYLRQARDLLLPRLLNFKCKQSFRKYSL